MISAVVTCASAALLLLGGVALLFAPDVVLPALAPGVPPSALWLGQLLGAAWLAVAALNWLQRSSVLGGIYGRPVVMANVVLHFVGALVLLRALREPGTARAAWGLAVPMAVLALVYGALLLRGPFDPPRRD